jgi:hypothetical protein
MSTSSVAARILVCVTHSDVADALRVPLVGLHAEIDTQIGIDDALAAALKEPPRVAFVELGTDLGSIVAFAGALRNMPACAHLPICVIGSSELAGEAQANNCEFLPSPLSLVALRRVARGLLTSFKG